jgi:hypothetical protein
MSMMAMGWMLGMLMVFVLVVAIGVFVALRVLGGREVSEDHVGANPNDPRA